jgi:exodeoxyribonuclease VII large subunit
MSDHGVFTVSELTRQIKLILENNLPDLWVEGEIFDFTWPSSGHMYFSLKDKHSQLRCVMWRSHNEHLFFTPRDGLQVQTQGSITVYEKGGQYQFTVTQMHPLGLGNLRIAFERLANTLRAEGLFRQEHKKPMPSFPVRIGVVTSPTGAALQDIVRVISRRFPPAQISLRPVPVQGAGAAEQIARAIEELNAQRYVQVIIVGRGGGSLEDLWAFNEERVARAIFASHIPIISAVGHEIDVTISDLVADLRAPTPSAAAELVVPHKREVLALLREFHGRMSKAMESGIRARRIRVDGLRKSHGILRCVDLIAQKWQLIDQLGGRLRRGWEKTKGQWDGALRIYSQRLLALDPRGVLRRGYSVCRRLADWKVISDARSLRPADAIEVTFARGRIEGLVSEVKAKGLPGTSRRLEDG